MKSIELLFGAVGGVRPDQKPPGAVERGADTVDVPSQARIDRNDRIVQLILFDEIVWQLLRASWRAPGITR